MMIRISLKILCGEKLGGYRQTKFDKMLVNTEADDGYLEKIHHTVLSSVYVFKMSILKSYYLNKYGSSKGPFSWNHLNIGRRLRNRNTSSIFSTHLQRARRNPKAQSVKEAFQMHEGQIGVWEHPERWHLWLQIPMNPRELRSPKGMAGRGLLCSLQH